MHILVHRSIGLGSGAKKTWSGRAWSSFSSLYHSPTRSLQLLQICCATQWWWGGWCQFSLWHQGIASIEIYHSVTWALDACPALLNSAVPVAPTAPFHLLSLSLKCSLRRLSSQCEALDASALWYPPWSKFKRTPGNPLALSHTTRRHRRGLAAA